MDLELFLTPRCPHQERAAVLLRALDDVGLTTAQFATTVITTAEQATRLGFIGSPTILVNGQDLFAVLRAQPALACRIYSGPAGPAGTHLCETSDGRSNAPLLASASGDAEA